MIEGPVLRIFINNEFVPGTVVYTISKRSVWLLANERVLAQIAKISSSLTSQIDIKIFAGEIRDPNNIDEKGNILVYHIKKAMFNVYEIHSDFQNLARLQFYLDD